MTPQPPFKEDSTKKEEHGYLRIRKEDIPVRTLWLEQSKLKFFVDNPRIYSLVRAGGREPDQDDIYKELLEQEHVRELKEDIRLNGGLIDPLIVRDGSLEVLEGNSRLAASRWLYNNEDPIAWAKVKCTLLPADISEQLIFAILGQYHIRGKKDWVPYEKAGFLHRRFTHHKQDIPTVATELGIGVPEAKHLIDVFEFMLRHGEANPARWSHYDEFIKSKKIKKVREQYPDFDKIIVDKVKKNEIKRAVDIRDSLPAICVGPGKNLKRFVEGKTNFNDAYQNAMDAGGGNTEYKRLYAFRQWLAKSDTEKDLVETKERNVRDKIAFELAQIEKRVRQLKTSLTKAAAAK
jgi:ParB-like nuclease domain